MTHDELMRALRGELANRVFDVDRAVQVVMDAGLDRRLIRWSTRPLENWRSILEEAERRGSEHVFRLVDAAAPGGSPELRSLTTAYGDWVSGGKQLTERERGLASLADEYKLYSADDGEPLAPPVRLRTMDGILARHSLFGGRETALQRLDAHATEGAGYFFVTGPSGFGKSALLATWVKSMLRRGLPVLYHFLSRAEDTAKEPQALGSLCEQLAFQHGLRGGGELNASVLRVAYPKLLSLPPEGRGPFTVVLDGIDEAEGWELRLEQFKVSLPDGVRVIFSARAEANVDWLAKLGIPGAPRLELDRMEVVEIRSLLQAAGGQALWLADDDAVVNEVHGVSGGDPFYLNLLVQDVLEGKVTAANVAAQPRGLEAYLDAWGAQLSNEVALEREATHDLLALVSVARGRLLPSELGALSDTLSRGLLLKRELEGGLRRYLTGDRASGYAIAHPRFGKYLTEQLFGPAEVAAQRQRLRAYCEDWAKNRSLYALRHCAAHLEEAVTGSQGAERAEHLERLVRTVSAPDFQDAHDAVVQDLPALQRDIVRALTLACDEGSGDGAYLPVKAALSLRHLRARKLAPDAVFELARAGRVRDARQRLGLFDLDPDFERAIVLLIAWLGRDKGGVESEALLAEVLVERPQRAPLGRLWDCVAGRQRRRVIGAAEAAPPDVEWKARGAVERIKGSGDQELMYGARTPFAQGELMQVNLLSRDAAQPELGYLAAIDGPDLVAFALKDPVQGGACVDEYLMAHAGYTYTFYRNRSLWLFLDAVLRHPSDAWVRDTVEKVARVAMSPGFDYTGALGCALSAACEPASVPGVPRFDELLARLDADRAALGGRADASGSFKRWAGAASEAMVTLLHRAADASALLQRASQWTDGYAGFKAPALLALAESVHICRPGDAPLLDAALNGAFEAAQNIQDALFCARTTARVHAMRARWWAGPAIAQLPDVIAHLRSSPGAPELSSVRLRAEPFAARTPEQKLPLPDTLRDARTLRAFADAYHRPLEDFLRVNADSGWAPDDSIADDELVNIPDPGLAPLIAARLAAEVIVSSLPDKAHWIATLVPVALPNPTALDTVLARLVLVAPPNDTALLAELSRAAFAESAPSTMQ